MTVGNGAGGSDSRQWEVHKHWHEFLVTSSVRGLKRTTSSETRFLRLFWIVFLLASLALMLYQILSVVDTYVSQKDSTAMQSKRLDMDVPFPAVSVCREAAYASHEQIRRVMLRHNASVTTPQSYSHRVADMLYRRFHNATNMTGAELEEAEMAILTFDTPRSYQAQIPRAAIKEVALPLIHQLATARANFMNGSSANLAFNMDIIGLDDNEYTPNASSIFDAELTGMLVRDFYHWRYFLCQTLEITLSEQDQSNMHSLDLLLWHSADNFNTSGSGLGDRAFPMRGFWAADSIRLALHPAGQHGKVHIDNGATLVQGGGFTEIRFSPTVTQYLNCSSRKLRHGDQGNYEYNLNDCKYLSYDQELRRKCNCTLDPLAFNYKQCMRIDWSSLEKSDWGGCMGTTEWSHDTCAHPTCLDIEYRYETSFAPWNINDFQWKWIFDLLQNLEDAMPVYLAMSQKSDGGNSVDYSESTGYFHALKGNLTSLTIIRQSGLIAYQQEVRLTSLANMFSSCGGAMSLFMGITLTLLAEFFEFLYKVCRQGCQRSSTSTASAQSSLPMKQQDAVPGDGDSGEDAARDPTEEGPKPADVASILEERL